jgi:protocatechuate 3,4-dioxygenase beta subunit
MTTSLLNRRSLLAGGGFAFATGASALITPARADGLEPTPSMLGGSNNYHPGAPIMERVGKGGFLMTGTVRRAGDGALLSGQRIQVWAHTVEAYEDNWRSHGATLTDANGVFRIEIPQIIPAFGQPHGHFAYDPHFTNDDVKYKIVFLRPVLPNLQVTSLEAHFVLQSA